MRNTRSYPLFEQEVITDFKFQVKFPIKTVKGHKLLSFTRNLDLVSTHLGKEIKTIV